jgi:hypothetical protein
MNMLVVASGQKCLLNPWELLDGKAKSGRIAAMTFTSAGSSVVELERERIATRFVSRPHANGASLVVATRADFPADRNRRKRADEALALRENRVRETPTRTR